MTPRARRIGILGGTFDPIHCGHLDVGDAAMKELGLARMLVMPSNVPPHRSQPAASSFHRFAMVSLAILGRAQWQACDLELMAPAPSFTSTTLQSLRQQGRDPRDLFFVVGADAFAEIGAWHDYPAILDEANFVVVSRPHAPAGTLPERLPRIADRMVHGAAGHGDAAAPPAKRNTSIVLVDARTADVSSTEIRRRIRAGESIAGLVPPAVLHYIGQHDLYGGTHGED